MACGCDSSASPSAPLLTGTLDPVFASPASPANPPSEENIFGAATPTKPSTRFWEAVAVIVFLVAASWVVYKSEKKSE